MKIYSFIGRMNFPVPCMVCQSITSCRCKNGLLGFFQLLKSVDQRVLRLKPSSTQAQPMTVGGGIDKLEGFFTGTLSTEIVRLNAKQLGATIKKVFLRDRRAYLEIGFINQVIHLKLGIDSRDITGFVSNPNRFLTWQTYWTLLTSICTASIIKSAQISRLDLNLDFDIKFMDLIKTIDIKCKQKSLTFVDSKGERTGLIIGKGPESILVYDKAKQVNSDQPLTRIEIRLRGKKLPTRSIEHLPEKILSKTFFEGIIGINCTKKRIFTTPEQKSKLETFTSILDRDGFYNAKKLSNKLRNFDRDFEKLLEVTYWHIQPADIFSSEIKTFFTRKEAVTWTH